jgi:mRNA interferase RelE/StbE
MELIFEASAAKSVARMPRRDAAGLRRKLEAFANDPYAPHTWAKPLVGIAAVRVRHGDWRAICRVDGKALVVLVVEIGHRKEIYR